MNIFRRTFLLSFLLALNILVAPTVLAKEQSGSVRLIFVGDLMLDDGPGKTIASGGDPLALFDGQLKDADYSIGNLETPIAASATGQPLLSKIYTFRSHPKVTRILEGRFNAVALANNHSGDYGKEAFLETMRWLAGKNIAYFGGGKSLTEAHKPLWIARNGLRIAVLSYNEFKPRSFEAGANWPGIAWSEDSQVVADIRAARKAGADLVIPFMHWGWERETTPSARQKQLARLMVDAGADIVVGGHPHVTQGAEYYKGKLIVYSLGNFVFDSFNTDETRRGWLLKLTVDKHGLQRWETQVAEMDDAGTPHPRPDLASPCGKAGDMHVSSCLSGAVSARP